MLKLYPISSALLLVLIHPRKFGIRFAMAMAICLALPFLFQRFDYVWRQYQLWANYMIIEDRSTWGLADTNLDFQLLCRVWWREISLSTYRFVELGAAGIFAGIILLMKRAGRPALRLQYMALALSCVWMTVFGPATESPTYVLLAPCVAWSVVSSRPRQDGRLAFSLQRLSYLLLASALLSGMFRFFITSYRTQGPQPLGGLVFLAGLLASELSWRQQPVERAISAPETSGLAKAA
jgi:hypothetical protein